VSNEPRNPSRSSITLITTTTTTTIIIIIIVVVVVVVVTTTTIAVSSRRVGRSPATASQPASRRTGRCLTRYAKSLRPYSGRAQSCP
jgi:flagellar basal body-associated protein FliL